MLRLVDGLGYDVSVIAASRSWAGDRDIGAIGRIESIIDVPDEQTTTAARLRRLWRLAAGSGGPGRPGPWAMNYAAAGYDDAVVAAAKRLRPDVIILRSTFAHLINAIRPYAGRVVLDVHDAEFFLARSLTYLSDPLRILPAMLRVVAAARLDRLVADADEVWAPSQREIEHLCRHAPGAHVLLVPNGVPVPDEPPPYEHRQPELLLIGGFGYPPNEAAAVRLVEEVLPKVVRSVPKAHVTLVGRDLRTDLREPWADRPVSWLGVVDDLVPLYRRAAALVLPYDPTTQTGTPLKIAESMAQGLPVVATPNATRELGVRSGEHVLNAVTADELAGATVRVLTDEPRARALSRSAHAWTRQHLAPDRILARLRRESILSSAPPV
jgi:glycosyltransferase involved in cell wall biosynthesis